MMISHKNNFSGQGGKISFSGHVGALKEKIPLSSRINFSSNYIGSDVAQNERIRIDCNYEIKINQLNISHNDHIKTLVHHTAIKNNDIQRGIFSFSYGAFPIWTERNFPP